MIDKARLESLKEAFAAKGLRIWHRRADGAPEFRYKGLHWVQMDDEGDFHEVTGEYPSPDMTYRLSYDRHDDKWRIVLWNWSGGVEVLKGDDPYELVDGTVELLAVWREQEDVWIDERARGAFSGERGVQTPYRRSVANEFARLSGNGDGTYAVLTSVIWEDGDHLTPILRRGKDNWELSDGGDIYNRFWGGAGNVMFNYDFDADLCEKIIEETAQIYEVEVREGELLIEIIDGGFGEALSKMISLGETIRSAFWAMNIGFMHEGAANRSKFARE